MNFKQWGAAVAIALGLASVSAGQDEFVKNRLFVVTAGGGASLVHELGVDLNGGGSMTTVERTFGDTELQTPYGAAFGPNGNLFVSSVIPGDATGLGKIVEYGPDGAIVQEITSGLLVNPRGLAFGQSGNLLVCCASPTPRVLELSPQGAVVQSIGVGSPMTNPSGIAVGPNGHLYVADATNNAVYEFIPEAGTQPVRTILAGGNLNIPQGLAFGPRGHLFVVNRVGNNVVEIAEDGGQVLQINSLLLDDPNQIAFGPDGNIYVSSETSNRILVFDGDETPPQGTPPFGEIASLGTNFAISAPRALAFAPHRMGVNVKGSFERQNVGSVKGKQTYKNGSGPILSYAPGSRTAMLQIEDDPADDTDLASLLGATQFIFRGYLGTEENDSKTRSFAGHEFPEPSFDVGSTTILINIAGKTPDGVFHKIKDLDGRLIRMGRTGVYDGKIVFKTRLN